VAAQRGDRAGQRLAVELGDVELDDVREGEQRLGARGVAEVIQRDAEAVGDGVADDRDQHVVGAAAGVDLEHDVLGRQRERAHGEQELARDRHVGGQRADEPVDADVGEGLDEHARSLAARIHDRLGGRQELEADHVLGTVEDRLACDDDRRSGGRVGPSKACGR
jgi:hypothetical protein